MTPPVISQGTYQIGVFQVWENWTCVVNNATQLYTTSVKSRDTCRNFLEQRELKSS